MVPAWHELSDDLGPVGCNHVSGHCAAHGAAGLDETPRLGSDGFSQSKCRTLKL
jgi:hypothetical protein